MRRTPTIIGAGAIALALGPTACTAEPQPDSSTTLQDQESRTSPSSTDEARPGYRDGNYSARGWYGSLPSHHDVTLTIEGDMVTAVEITTPAEDETSLGYQQRFAAGLPAAIVGRNVDELAIDRLAGSSGCSDGFLDALAKIKDRAAA